MATSPDYGRAQAKRTTQNVPIARQYRPKGQSVRVLKYRGQKRDGDQGAGEGARGADKCLTTDAVSKRPHEIRDLVEPGEQDHRRREQEGEPLPNPCNPSPESARPPSSRPSG